MSGSSLAGLEYVEVLERTFFQSRPLPISPCKSHDVVASLITVSRYGHVRDFLFSKSLHLSG